MLAGKPLQSYMTISDLAFAVLVLEQHMMQWRQMILLRLETGQLPLKAQRKEPMGLLYKSGVAGKEGKERFRSLVACFSKAFAGGGPKSAGNLGRLQDQVDKMAMAEAARIKAEMKGSLEADKEALKSSRSVQDEILHQVFYCACL